MAPSRDSTLLVIGSGPGIGSATACVFAQEGFDKVALISRNEERLKQDCHAVEEAARQRGKSVSIGSWAVDITDTAAFQAALDKVANFGTVECILFNAARVQPSDLLQESIDEVEYDFRITNIALLTTARWAVPLFQKLAKSDVAISPSLFVTNSLLYKEPIPQLFSLSLTKTAQRNLVQSLRASYQKDGIHVAVISVGGQVSPDAKVLNPRNIAQKIWGLFKQSKSEWTWDLELLEE